MIHDLIMTKVQAVLQAALIDNVVGVSTRAGIVMQGPLQGNPDPDVARISVTVHENDPDQLGYNLPTSTREPWDDTVEEVEIGGVITWSRKFTVRARCLLEQSREGLSDARQITSTVRSRIEKALLGINFVDVHSDNEYVSRGVFGEKIRGEVIQSGGPDAYDFLIKVRFEVWTTTTEV